MEVYGLADPVGFGGGWDGVDGGNPGKNGCGPFSGSFFPDRSPPIGSLRSLGRLALSDNWFELDKWIVRHAGPMIRGKSLWFVAEGQEVLGYGVADEARLDPEAELGSALGILISSSPEFAGKGLKGLPLTEGIEIHVAHSWKKKLKYSSIRGLPTLAHLLVGRFCACGSVDAAFLIARNRNESFGRSDRQQFNSVLGLLRRRCEQIMSPICAKRQLAVPMCENPSGSADRQAFAAMTCLHNLSGAEQAVTSREMQVVYAVIQGKSNAQIGQRFGISCRTVEKHLENIFSKTGCRSRKELISRIIGE